MVPAQPIREAKKARLETIRAQRRSLRKRICDYERWESLASAWPVLHVRLGLQTVPVLRETAWQSFEDVLDGVDVVARRFGEFADESPGSVFRSLDWNPGESLLHSTRAILWKTATEVSFGEFVLTSDRIVFLPFERCAEGRLECAVSDVEVVAEKELEASQIALRLRETEALFTTANGEALRNEIQDTVEAANLANFGGVTLDQQPVSSVLGEAQCVRVSVNGEVIRELRQTQILQLDEFQEHLGLLFHGIPTSELESVSAIELEVQKYDAIYRFECELNTIHRCPRYVEEQLGSSAFLLTFFAPVTVRRFNRRSSFRVRIVEDFEVSLSGAPGAVKLLDISTDGCAYLGPSGTHVGESVSLTLPRGRKSFAVEGVVRNCSFEQNTGKWRYGIQFRGTGAEEMAALQNLVMNAQRALLSDVAERRVVL